MTQFPFPVSANDSHTGSIVTEMDKYLIRKRKSDIDSDDDHDGECESFAISIKHEDIDDWMWIFECTVTTWVARFAVHQL